MTETVGAYWTEREEWKKKMQNGTPVAVVVCMEDGSELTIESANGWKKEIEFLLGIWEEPVPRETEKAWRLANGRWPEPFVAVSRATLKRLKGKVSMDTLGLLTAIHYEADFGNGKYAFSIARMAREWGWDWDHIKKARGELEKLVCISIEDRGRGRVSPITILRNEPQGLTGKNLPVRPGGLPPTRKIRDDNSTSAFANAPRKETPSVHEERGSVTEDRDPREVDHYRSALLGLVRSEKTGKPRKPYPHEKKMIDEFIRTLPLERLDSVLTEVRANCSIKSPFGWAVTALKKGWSVGPKEHTVGGRVFSPREERQPPSKKVAPTFCPKCAGLGDDGCRCPDPKPRRVLLGELTPIQQRMWEGVSLEFF